MQKYFMVLAKEKIRQLQTLMQRQMNNVNGCYLMASESFIPTNKQMCKLSLTHTQTHKLTFTRELDEKNDSIL